jgi:hypothetical protein
MAGAQLSQYVTCADLVAFHWQPNYRYGVTSDTSFSFKTVIAEGFLASLLPSTFAGNTDVQSL